MTKLPEPPAQIDTVRDALLRLGAMFPKHRDEIMAWAQGFQRVLGHLPPDRLRSVFASVVDAWEKGYPPKPKDFAAKLGGESAPSSSPSNVRVDGDLAEFQRRNQLTTRAWEVAKELLERSKTANRENFERAAARWRVSVVDIACFADRHVFRATPLRKSYEIFQRHFRIAIAHLANNEPLPDFIELTQDEWAKARIYAEARRDRPEAFDVEQVYGFRGVGRPGREKPEIEDRRRGAIANAEVAAERAEHGDAA